MSATFYGGRLREAREARGFSLQQVADHLGITKQAVSLYEKAKAFPKNESFQKLVDLLRVPSHFFSIPLLPRQMSPTYYRSMSAATKQMRDANEQKLNWLRQAVHYLSPFVEQPPVDLPPFDFPSDPLRITVDAIEECASGVRKYWGLGDGVISNVVHLLENKGIVVARFPLESGKLDAFSIIEDDTKRAYIVLASDKDSFFRSRHDAAHELGHLVMHRNVPAQVLRDTVAFKEMERQAHRFASAFLLPAKTFGAERITPAIESFKSLKLKWKSAISAMIMRATDLGIISDSQKTTLMATMSRKGWRTREPHDNDVAPEIPRYFRRTCEMIVEASLATKEQLLFDMGLNKADVESLFSMEGFFDDKSPAEIDAPQPVLKFPSPSAASGS